MIDAERDSLLKQLKSTQDRLNILEEQAAAYGSLNVPAHIKIQIEDARLKLGEIEEKLGQKRTFEARPSGKLPPYHNFFHNRNPNFTGRENLLTELEKALENQQTRVINQAIAGLGGVGKTQLAVEHAYRQAHKLSLVWWVNAEEPTNLKADLEKLAVKLGLIAEGQEQPVAIKKALEFLETQAGRWLLVYDNVNRPEDLQDYCPKGGQGQILITSRWQVWDGYADSLALKTWDKPQAVKFLLKRTKRTDKAGAAQLAEKLGYLPLALEHAGAYLAQNKIITFAEYLADFEQQKLALLEEGKLTTNHHNDTISSTWQISLKDLPTEATDLLSLCAWLAPDNIPINMFLNNAEELPEALSIAAAKKRSFSKTLATLQQYSLVELNQDNQSFSVHRLLQMVIREGSQGLGVGGQVGEEGTLTPPSLLGKGAGTRLRVGLGFAIRLINAASPNNIQDYRTWAEYAPVLPHALFVTEEVERLEIEPEAIGYILNQAGLYLQGRADYQTALDLFQRAIAIGEKTLGADHPTVAIRYNNLGGLLQDLGDLPNARIYYEKALAIREKAFGKEHPDVAQSYNNLGGLLKNLGELPNARIYFEKALAIFEKVLGENHPNVATLNNNLGVLLKELGDFPSARDYFEKALAIREKAFGKEHPDVAISLWSLGVVAEEEGNIAEARRNMERALAILREKLGENHPNTQSVRRWLAGLP